MKTSIFKAITILVMLISISVFGQDNKGLEIVKAAKKARTGWKTSSQTMTMTLTNRNGQKTVRKMHGYNMEVENDGDKSMTIFDTPKDVKGTVSMTYTHRTQDDDQWLYLPAIRRVKRISSSTKSGPFLGSEFAFEDIGSEEVEKYTYKYISEDQVDGVMCYKIERYPVSKSSGYKRNIVWYNKENYRAEKIEFYDRKNALLKTLSYAEYKLYQNKYWRASMMNMKNHQNGKETLLEFSNLKFGVEISDDNFSQNALKRAN